MINFFKNHLAKRAQRKADKSAKGEASAKHEFKSLLAQLDHDDLSEYMRYLRSPWHIWWNNFFAGMARGLGFIVGATILVSLMVYLFVNVFVNLPVVGETFQWFNENIKIEEIKNLGNSLYQLSQMQQEQIELLKKIAH